MWGLKWSDEITPSGRHLARQSQSNARQRAAGRAPGVCGFSQSVQPLRLNGSVSDYARRESGSICWIRRLPNRNRLRNARDCDVHQPRTLDLAARQGKFLESAPDYVTGEVLARLQAII